MPSSRAARLAAAAEPDSRRAEICRAAARIFRDRGFDATAMSDIARALRMTKAGLYHYFPSKEAMLFEIMTFGLERMEEEVFYPPLRENKKTHDIVLEGYQEHHVADLIMDELLDMPVDAEMWQAKAKVLKENIEHHIEEEEDEMFKKARKVLSDEQLEELGTRMEAVRDESLGTLD